MSRISTQLGESDSNRQPARLRKAKSLRAGLLVNPAVQRGRQPQPKADPPLAEVALIIKPRTPWVGLEPTTYWLTASCSTIELPRSTGGYNRILVVPQLLHPYMFLNFFKCFCLNLTDTFTGNAKFLPYLLKCMRYTIFEAKSHFKYLLFTR